MPKSKNRKDHKKKASKRKEKLIMDKKRLEKAKKEFINQLIKQEQDKGLFENNEPVELNKEPEGPQI
jgi:hypothetical protein